MEKEENGVKKITNKEKEFGQGGSRDLSVERVIQTDKKIVAQELKLVKMILRRNPNLKRLGELQKTLEKAAKDPKTRTTKSREIDLLQAREITKYLKLGSEK